MAGLLHLARDRGCSLHVRSCTNCWT